MNRASDSSESSDQPPDAQHDTFSPPRAPIATSSLGDRPRDTPHGDDSNHPVDPAGYPRDVEHYNPGDGTSDFGDRCSVDSLQLGQQEAADYQGIMIDVTRAEDFFGKFFEKQLKQPREATGTRTLSRAELTHDQCQIIIEEALNGGASLHERDDTPF